MAKQKSQGAVAPRRLFLLGAGFSAAVGMPVSAQVPARLAQANDDLRNDITMDNWRQRAAAVYQLPDPACMDVEMLFETMYLELELLKMRAQIDAFDFKDLREHEWVRTVATAISVAYKEFMALLRGEGDRANIAPLTRWAETVTDSDYIATFNYDVVCERLLTAVQRPFSLAARPGPIPKTRLLKLHGSVDWIKVQHGRKLPEGCSVLFDPFTDINHGNGPANPPDDDDVSRPEHFCIAHCPSFGLARSVLRDYFPPTHNFAVVGFSRTKTPGEVTGLGAIWHEAGVGLYHCDEVIAIGFALSRFDALARHFIADTIRIRRTAGKPDPRLRIVDPNFKDIRASYRHVFGIEPEELGDRAESVDWTVV